jgi:hypothetical protein
MPRWVTWTSSSIDHHGHGVLGVDHTSELADVEEVLGRGSQDEWAVTYFGAQIHRLPQERPSYNEGCVEYWKPTSRMGSLRCRAPKSVTSRPGPWSRCSDQEAGMRGLRRRLCCCRTGSKQRSPR